MKNFKLRDYQKECVDIVDNLSGGSHLIQMATGLGKTVTFANFKRKGRVLVLAHREELITQPLKYYDCPVGIEMASNKSNGEDVVIASVLSLTHRLERFNPDDFDMIITDECHHAAANSYRKIYDYFKPRIHIGMTATPNRGDNVRLDDIFEDIIFERDIRWAIQNHYLCDIHCLRVDIGYDISKVARRMGDYAIGELEEALNQDVINSSIKEVYEKYAKGQTLIFATTVEHAKAIARKIEGAVAVTGNTKDREEIVRKFKNKEIPVLVNCMIFTEGTDIPNIETIMIARPTSSSSLYIQMVGRGLRLAEGKDKLTLIDLVGTTGKNDLCSAPTLLGEDMSVVPESKQKEIQGDLFDLPDKIVAAQDCVESWIKNVEIVDLWAKGQQYNTHNVNYFKMPNGSMVVYVKGGKIVIPPPDLLGKNNGVSMQTAFDDVYKTLKEKHSDSEYIWNLDKIKRWAYQPASDKQKMAIARFKKGIDVDNLNKFQASQILNRLCYR